MVVADLWIVTNERYSRLKQIKSVMAEPPNFYMSSRALAQRPSSVVQASNTASCCEGGLLTSTVGSAARTSIILMRPVK